VDKIIIDWDDFSHSNLKLVFGDNETYDSLQTKLKAIRYNPLRFESFFYSVSNILDDMGISNVERRINAYIRQLPIDIARAIAATGPADENELYINLKSISRYYKSNVNEENTNVIEIENKGNGKEKEKDITESFATELANALCCALEQKDISFRKRGRGGTNTRSYNNYSRGGNYRGNTYRGNQYRNNSYRGNFRGNRGYGYRGNGNYGNQRGFYRGNYRGDNNSNNYNQRGNYNNRNRDEQLAIEGSNTQGHVENPKGCFNCGEEGHFKRECPLIQGNANRRGHRN